MKVQTKNRSIKGVVGLLIFLTISIGSVSGRILDPNLLNWLSISPHSPALTDIFRPRKDSNLLDPPSVTTDKADYPIGATVLISGSGWQSGETVTLQVTDNLSSTDPNETAHQPWDVVADANGNISSSWVVDEDADNLTLTLTAHGHSSGLDASTTFTDANPSANLDQCGNDPFPSPSTDGCDDGTANPDQWVNGNLNEHDSVYFEGDSIPYRMRFDNLNTSIAHTVTINWDTTKGGKHAIDYLTTFNRTVSTANPCLDVTGCSSFTEFDIPKDPQVDNGAGSPITQGAGKFRLYGGTIQSVSIYTYPDGSGFTGDKSASITITFTTTAENPVLAWGGHIAQRRANAFSGGWGDLNSAVSISGSPYHMRLFDLDGSGGNQDRSLSADAVIFPGSITIIKDAVPNDPQDFNFAATGGLTPASFILDDDADGTRPNTQLYSNIFVTDQNGNNYGVTETPVFGWALTFGSPPCTVASANGGSQLVVTNGVSINLREGEDVTCVFTNTEDFNQTRGRIIVVKDTVPDDTQSFTFTPSYNGGATFNLMDGQSNDSCGVGDNCLVAGLYSVSEAPNSAYTTTSSCSDGSPVTAIDVSEGETVTCTFTNTRNTGSLKLSKSLTGGPDGYTGPFTINYDCDDGTAHDGNVSIASGASSTISGIPTGTSCTVSETPPTAPTGYTFGTPTFSPSATVTITTKDATVEVTTNNTLTRDTGSLKLSKSLTGGPAGYTGPFTIGYDCNDGTAHDGSVSVNSGSSQTISGIPTGTSCTVSETPPTPPTGYTFGTPTFSPSATVAITTKGATVEVTTNNTLTRDLGSLQIKKTLSNPDGALVPASFTVNYDCGTGYTGQVSVAPGSPATVNGIPTGNTCTVTEVAPAAIPNYTWGTITYTPASVVISTKGGTFCITVGNSITRDRGTIVVIKNAKPAQGSFAFTTTSSGTGSGYNGFTLTGSTAGGGNQNSQTLPTGNYTVKESTQLGWILTGIGGSTDPTTPYNCVVTGSSGSTGVGDLGTQTATITLKKGDTVTCTFENTGNGATRTQGFWATHTPLANIAWFGGSAFNHTFPGVAGVAGIGDRTLCGRPIDTLGKLMGGFWSGVSNTSTGKKRSALDQARMQLLQQLLAAELNASAFGSVPGSGSFSAWENAYCGTNQSAIQTALQQAGSFNNSGDSSTFTPGTSADSKNARAVANYTFWDVLP